MYILQVDGQVNPTLQSIHLVRFPITTAHFTKDGTEVIIAGKRKSFFVYDMMAGKITHIPGIRGSCELPVVLVKLLYVFLVCR